jgi:hypothetical protein
MKVKSELLQFQISHINWEQTVDISRQKMVKIMMGGGKQAEPLYRGIRPILYSKYVKQIYLRNGISKPNNWM